MPMGQLRSEWAPLGWTTRRLACAESTTRRYGARGVLRTMKLPGSTERLYLIPDVEKLAVQRAARVAS